MSELETAIPVSSSLHQPQSWTGFVNHNFQDVAGVWQSVSAEDSAPMSQYIWAEACWNALPRKGELLIIGMRRGSTLGAVVPLVTSGVLGRAEHLGVEYLHEPSEVFYTDPDAVRALARKLSRTGLPLFLHRVPADSPTLTALREEYRGTVFLSPRAAYPRIALSPDWSEPERQLNSGRRSDLRRAMRTATKSGPVSFEVKSPTTAELPSLLEEAFDVEAANWKGREGSAIARDRLRGDFYRRYASAAAAAGILRLCFLRIGGRAAAMQYAVESGSSFWLLKIGYRDEFARCSPGMLLIAETIRYSATRGLKSYEFLGSVESWTRVWTKDERESFAVSAYPLGVRGVTALSKDAMQVALRRTRRILRGSK